MKKNIIIIIFTLLILTIFAFLFFFILNQNKYENIPTAKYEDTVIIEKGGTVRIDGTDTLITYQDSYHRSEDIGDYADNPTYETILLVDGKNGAKIIKSTDDNQEYGQSRFIYKQKNNDRVGLWIQKIWQDSSEYKCWDGTSSSTQMDPNKVICSFSSNTTDRYCTDDYVQWASTNCPQLTFSKSNETQGECFGQSGCISPTACPIGNYIDIKEFIKSLPQDIELIEQNTVDKAILADYDRMGCDIENPTNIYCEGLKEGEWITSKIEGLELLLEDGVVYKNHRPEIVLQYQENNDLALILKLREMFIENIGLTTTFSLRTEGGCNLSQKQILTMYEKLFIKLGLNVEELKNVNIQKSRYYPE
ncbi:MAG: hypothetical protein ABIF80_00095 [Patescibacteria group bacterium]